MNNHEPPVVLNFDILDRIIVGIGELIEITGVTSRQIRYWEDKGIIKSLHDGKGTRKYDYATVEKVVLIKEFLDQGYTLEAAAQRMDERINRLNDVITTLAAKHKDTSHQTPNSKDIEWIGLATHEQSQKKYMVYRRKDQPGLWISEQA